MITTNTLTIIQVLSDIYTGRIRIPDFQRSPVWNANDAELLLDSIYNGYPLGSFLLWETSDELKERNPLSLAPRPPRPERQYLIDGQQRTIMLYGIFTDILKIGEEPKQVDYKAFFDLDDESFNLYKKSDLAHDPGKVKESQIPLNEAIIFDLEVRVGTPSTDISKKLMKEQNLHKMNSFQKLVRTFTSHVVAGVVVQGVSLAEACEIFVRMNKSGVALNIVDLMVARTYSVDPPFNLRDELEEFNSGNAPRGYQLKERTILQCAAACLRKGCSQKDILKSAEGNRLRVNWENCTRALNTALDFLQGRMVKVSNFLPNEIILAPLTYFFFMQRRPSARHYSELTNFFWGSGISQRYVEGQNRKVAEDIKLMNNLRQRRRVPEIDYSVTTDDVAKQKLRLSSAFCKSILCLLSTKNPRDWITNQPVNLITSFSAANERQFHHIFPKKYLKTLSNAPEYEAQIKPYIDSIANICLLTALSNERVGAKPPSQYIAEIEERDNSELQETLLTHMITEETYSRLLEDDFSGFIRARSADISDELNMKLQFAH